jgi:hypothetical protein
MSEARNQRRVAKRNAKQVGLSGQRVVAEVFTISPGGEKPSFDLNISAMRSWAIATLEPKAVVLDIRIAEKLIKNGTVDPSYLQHAFSDASDLSPIIVCLKIDADGCDMIVDGNHRYVLACIANEKLKIGGAAPGYTLEPDQWRRFVIDRGQAQRAARL